VASVRVVAGDTAEVPRGAGTYASKSLQIGGVAAARAADEVVERARRLTADLLEASADDVVLDRESGRFHVAGAPQRALTWADLAAGDRVAELRAERDVTLDPTYAFGAHVAVVEVDTETGSVELVKLVAVDDAGRLVNPLIAE